MFKILEGGREPQIKTEFSSSADLCSREDMFIGAGETKAIPLGVKIDLEELRKLVFRNLDSAVSYYPEEHQDRIFNSWLKSHFLELKIRSSLSFKLIVANGVGEIDLDYPDEIGLIVHNPVRSGLAVQVVTLQQENSNHIQYLSGEVKIKAGDRVAQIKLMEHKNYLMPEKYRTSEKRTGGYGSTN